MAIVAAAAAALFVTAPWRGVAPPLSPRQTAAYVEAADRLAQQYVDDAWCTPLVAGTLGEVPSWPPVLATAAAQHRLLTGPAVGDVPDHPGIVKLDVSDARAVLPVPGRSWSVRPRFCVAQLAYPRLVTSGGTTHPEYPPLAHRLHDLNQIFSRFPIHLGRVTSISVPLTIEVAYSLRVDGGPARNLHLNWITAIDLVPESGTATTTPRLRLSTWDLDARAALVTVRTDAPPGPVVVHSSPPGAGP